MVFVKDNQGGEQRHRGSFLILHLGSYLEFSKTAKAESGGVWSRLLIFRLQVQIGIIKAVKAKSSGVQSRLLILGLGVGNNLSSHRFDPSVDFRMEQIPEEMSNMASNDVVRVDLPTFGMKPIDDAKVTPEQLQQLIYVWYDSVEESEVEAGPLMAQFWDLFTGHETQLLGDYGDTALDFVSRLSDFYLILATAHSSKVASTFIWHGITALLQMKGPLIQTPRPDKNLNGGHRFPLSRLIGTIVKKLAVTMSEQGSVIDTDSVISYQAQSGGGVPDGGDIPVAPVNQSTNINQLLTSPVAKSPVTPVNPLLSMPPTPASVYQGSAKSRPKHGTPQRFRNPLMTPKTVAAEKVSNFWKGSPISRLQTFRQSAPPARGQFIAAQHFDMATDDNSIGHLPKPATVAKNPFKTPPRQLAQHKVSNGPMPKAARISVGPRHIPKPGIMAKAPPPAATGTAAFWKARAMKALEATEHPETLFWRKTALEAEVTAVKAGKKANLSSQNLSKSVPSSTYVEEQEELYNFGLEFGITYIVDPGTNEHTGATPLALQHNLFDNRPKAAPAMAMYSMSYDANQGDSIRAPEDSMQAAMLQALVKMAKTEEEDNLVIGSNKHPTSFTQIGEDPKLLTLALRSFGTSSIKVEAHLSGTRLAVWLRNVSASVTNDALKDLGMPSPFTNRRALAFGAVAFGGTRFDTSFLSLCEVPQFLEREWYDFEDDPVGTIEQRARMPLTLQQWVEGSFHGISCFAGIFGAHHKKPMNRAIIQLVNMHKLDPDRFSHKWIVNTFDFLTHTYLMEHRSRIGQLLARMRLPHGLEPSPAELKHVAFMPGADGKALWKTPVEMWNLEDPTGFFQTRVVTKLNKRINGNLLRMATGQLSVPRAGGLPVNEHQQPTTTDAPKIPSFPLRPLYPKKFREILSKAKLVDTRGNNICWNFLSHGGCRINPCRHSHELPAQAIPLPIKVEILKRGGLKGEAKKTPEQAMASIKILMQSVIEDGNRVGQLNTDSPSDLDLVLASKRDNYLEDELREALKPATKGIQENLNSFKTEATRTADSIENYPAKVSDTFIRSLIDDKVQAEDCGEFPPGWLGGMVQQKLRSLTVNPLLGMDGPARCLDKKCTIEESDPVTSQCEKCWIPLHVACVDKHICAGTQMLDAAASRDRIRKAVDDTLKDSLGEAVKLFSTPPLFSDRVGFLENKLDFSYTAAISPDKFQVGEPVEVILGDKVRFSATEYGDSFHLKGHQHLRKCLAISIAAGLMHKSTSLQDVYSTAADIHEQWQSEAYAIKAALGRTQDNCRITEAEAALREFVHDLVNVNHDVDYHMLACFSPPILANSSVLILSVNTDLSWRCILFEACVSRRTIIILCYRQHATPLFFDGALPEVLNKIEAVGLLTRVHRRNWQTWLQHAEKNAVRKVSVSNLFTCHLNECMSNASVRKEKVRLLKGGLFRYGEIGMTTTIPEDSRIGASPAPDHLYEEVRPWYKVHKFHHCPLPLSCCNKSLLDSANASSQIWSDSASEDATCRLLAKIMVDIYKQLSRDTKQGTMIFMAIRISDLLLAEVRKTTDDGLAHVVAHIHLSTCMA